MTMRKIGIFTIGIAVLCLVSFGRTAIAAEPQRPEVNRSFDEKKEQKIHRISGHSSSEAFEELKDVEFLVDEDLLHKAVHRTFQGRTGEGISLSLRTLSLPGEESVGGRRIPRSGDLHIARMVAEVFPDESGPALLDLYEKGDATTKGNILRICGRMSGKIARDLLFRALDDKTFCGPENPEIDGPPMRLCDLAYNQLVLRYRIRNVLRTIGPTDRIERRDYHILQLKVRI